LFKIVFAVATEDESEAGVAGAYGVEEEEASDAAPRTAQTAAPWNRGYPA
jgi:hypothetical protein